MQLPRRTTAQFLVAILLLSTLSPTSAFADKSFSLDTARNNLTYVVSQLASLFSDLADAIASYIPGTSLTASAATPTPSPIAPPTPALDFLAMTTPEVSTPPTTTTASDAPQTTIIQQPVIERIVERTVPAPAASGISEQTLAGRLASLKDDLLLRIAAVASAPIAFSGSAPTTPVSTATFATSQRIDQLTNTAINTPTITGGTITGASISGTITASGGLNAGSLVFSDASATSTFAGGATFATGGGNVGIGTSTPGSVLSVAGDAYASGFYNTSGVTGGYKIDGNLILQASSTLNSFFIGQFVGNASTTGLQNYGLGTFALTSITTGNFNNAMGRAAMNALTTGSSNTAMGNEALRTNTTGSDNVAIGMYALRLNNSATSSVAIGSNAGNAAAIIHNQGGTYVGYFAGYGAQTNSDFNTLFGYQAGRGITTGSNNIWIGTATSSAGIANLTTGSQNILIGNNISLPSATASGQLNIGNIIYGTGITGTGSTVSSGNVGIGTSSPTAQLSTTGTVRFAGLGSGGANLVTDALGNVTASSDERLKDKQGDFTRGLAAINAISPVLYKWRPETGFDTQATYAGFFAQNVQAAIPEAVSPDSRGYLTLADRPILAALVNAVKELTQRFSDFASSITTHELVADNGSFHRVKTGELCVDDICVTREQFAAMVAAAGQAAGASPLSISTSAPQAPVVELNGNASSTIELGDTYNDLGARIVAPENDLNLGIIIVLDHATTTQVSIDADTPGEHTILYTVTSPTTGLTGSATRTVIVSPVAQPITDFGMTPPPQPDSQLPPDEPQSGNDNPFNAAEPANDNAPSTHVLSAS